MSFNRGGRGFNAPTAAENAITENVMSFYKYNAESDDPMNLLRAQRCLDAIIVRCQNDKQMPDPFKFFRRQRMLGPMRFSAQDALSFIDAVSQELESRQRSVLGI